MANVKRYGAWVLAGLVALVLLVPLLFCLFDGRNIERLVIRTPAAHHILTAERWTSPDRDWNPPDFIEGSGDQALMQGKGWQKVALPDQRPQYSTLSETLALGDRPLEKPQVLWYRIALPDLPSDGQDGSASLYIPRIMVNGTAAVYLDGRRIWQRPQRFVFQPYYDPVLIQLGGVPPHRPGPRFLYLRLAARVENGGELASLWIGPGETLLAAWHFRKTLQTGVVWWTWSAYSVLGVLSFTIWQRRRGTDGNRIYLWFSLIALLMPLLLMPSLSGSFTEIPEPFLLWLCNSGAFLMSICTVNFNTAAIGRRQPILERMVWIVGLGGVAVDTVYVLLYGSSLPIVYLSNRLINLAVIPMIFQNGHAIRAMLIFRNRFSVLIGGLYTLVTFMAVHDAMASSGKGYPEDLMFMTLFFPISLIVYALFLFGSYIQAIESVEQANENLQTALVSKEAELAISHRRLLDSQREQTLAQERQRMMQEMHDGIGASLVSALRYLQHGRKDVGTIAQVLEECIDDLKLSIDSLEPVGGDVLLLLSNLRFRLGSRLQGSGIKLHWQVVELPPLLWLDAPHGMHVLRILQEVLTNLLKHSNADMLRVATAVADHHGVAGVVISLTDNGRPFTPPRAEQIPVARKGLGNILSRTKRLGGHCQWQPLDDGNRFTLWLPLSQG